MPYRLLLFLCLATVVAYVQRTAMSVPAKTIQADLGIGPKELGLVMGVWYWVYAACQLPSGWLADRLGSKPALVLFAVGWSVLTGLAGLAGGFGGLLAVWGLMGAAQAGLFPCATKAIGATVPKTGQAFASGLLACSMALGGALGPFLTGRLLGPLTWPQVFALYAIPGLVWAAAFAVAVRRPGGTAPPAALPPMAWSRLWTDNPMRLLCLQQFLRASAVAFFYTWFPQFLQETRGVTEKAAGDLAAWPPLAGMFGGLLGGVFSDWVLRRTGSARLARQGMAVGAMAVCSTVATVAYFTPDPRGVAGLLCVAGFFGMAGGVSGYAVAIAYGGRRVATVFGTMNMCGNVGAGLFPFAVGNLVAWTGDWNTAMLLFAGLFAADGVIWAFLDPKGTLYPEEPT
ncbi:MAG: MFS transporter [Gemmataceae bacterium]|nr:MFS transporter [Gemmataceae bacterium]